MVGRADGGVSTDPNGGGVAPVIGSDGSGLLLTGVLCCGCRGPFKPGSDNCSSIEAEFVCFTSLTAFSSFALVS